MYVITNDDVRSLRAELTRIGAFHHRTARTWGKLALLLGSLALVVVLVALLPWWCALWLVPLAAVPAVSAAMIGHEAGHGSLAASKRHNEIALHLIFPLFAGLGAQYWKHKHNRLHHGHPNIVGRDPDIDVWPMALSTTAHAESSRLRRWLQRGGVQPHLFWALSLLLAFVMRFASWRYVAGRLRQRGLDRALAVDIACLVGHYVLWLGLPMVWFGAWPVLLFYGGLWVVGGLLLALIFAPAHIGLPVMNQDQRGGFQQQLDTTRNLVMPRWMSWFFIGLDYQVEHHLFPRIPHQNLASAGAVVEAWCGRVGAPYHSEGYAASLGQLTHHLQDAWQVEPVLATPRRGVAES